MSDTVKKDFQDAAAGFSVEIRSLYDNKTVLDVLSFESREAFCDFLRTEKIQSGGYLDLSQKDLSGMDFSGIDGNLIGADMRSAEITDEQVYLTFGTPMVTKAGQFTNKKKKKNGNTP